MNEPDVQSVEEAVEAFLAHKRGIGRKFVSEEHELSLLVAFADGYGIGRLAELTPRIVEEFLGSRPRSTPRSFNHLLSALAGLFDWAISHELLEGSPLRVARRRTTSRRVPFLFGIEEARRLVDVAGALSDNPRARDRGPTYRSIFALSYGLGLRAGEVCGLRLSDVDVDRQLLVVRGGKFGKSRLVPHGPRVAALVDEQVARRRAAGATASDAPLFSFDGTRPVHPGTASLTFHHLVPVLGLVVPNGVAPPTLHSLRHSFAVGCLLRWYREGLDPQSRLHQLSTFMGHVDPVSTAVYLTITPELLTEANQRYEAFAQAAFLEARP